MQPSHKVSAVFDDPNLVSAGGLLPAMRLAQNAGLHDLLEDLLRPPCPNPVAKSACVVAGMLTGADSIDDLDVLRHGAMGRLFGGVRAPSTLGTYLRSFTHGHVQQLDAVAGRFLAGLAEQVPGLLAGGEEMVFIDVDDTIREVHGHAKQGASFGYSGVRGLNAQIAAVSTPLAAPVLGAARLRRGSTNSGNGGGRLIAQAIKTARRAGATGQVLGRADSAYFRHDFISAIVRAKAWFSVTVRMNPSVVRAIASIPDDAWTPIRYPHAVWEEAEGRWISDAEVAEVPFTAFTSRRKADHIDCRLVVRRVRRLNPQAHTGQGELFTTHRHHGFVTNSTLSTIDADLAHRAHAVVEQVIAELKAGPLASLPSGSYAANAAWLAHTAIAYNLARAVGAATPGQQRARWETLRRRIINVPARVATSARRLTLHLPQQWPWAPGWETFFATATGPPRVATT